MRNFFDMAVGTREGLMTLAVCWDAGQLVDADFANRKSAIREWNSCNKKRALTLASG